MPKRGEKKELVDHALANAREALGRKLADTASQRKLLDALAECFGLARAPRRIEVYDNSHIQGTNAVGAMVVAGPEGFQKNQYRKFNIRSADLTPGDDFAMMREVLERRFKRLMTESPRVLPTGAPQRWRALMGRLACRELGYLAPLAGRGRSRSASGEGDSRKCVRGEPLTPTLSPQAGRGRRRGASEDIESDEALKHPTRPGPISSSSTAGAGSSPPRRRRSRRSASPTCRWSPSPRDRSAMPAARPSSCPAASRSS